jgi:hypothetical protein
MKLFSKHPNLRLLLLALVATGLLSAALSLKAAQNNTSVSDLVFPKKKANTNSSTEPSNSANSPATSQAAVDTSKPTPEPIPNADGKPQSEATTPAPTSGLTVTLTRASASASGIAAITNKVVSGTCTFTFGDGTTQTVALMAQLDYSGCQANGTGKAGQTVRVTVTSGSESVSSNTMTVQ